MTFDDFRNLVSVIDTEKGTESELLNELEVEIHFTKGQPIKCGLENIRLLDGKFVIAASETIGNGDDRAWDKNWDIAAEREYIELREVHRQTEQDEIDKLWAMLESGADQELEAKKTADQGASAAQTAPRPGEATYVPATADFAPDPEPKPEPAPNAPEFAPDDDLAEEDIMAHIPPGGGM